MSHTYKAPGGTAFIFNSDLSGLVSVVPKDGPRPISIPGDDLVDFVMENFVKSRLVSWLESTDLMKVLRLLNIWRP